MSVNTCEKMKIKSEFAYTLYHIVVRKTTLLLHTMPAYLECFILMNLDLSGTKEATMNVGKQQQNEQIFFLLRMRLVYLKKKQQQNQ